MVRLMSKLDVGNRSTVRRPSHSAESLILSVSRHFVCLVAKCVHPPYFASTDKARTRGECDHRTIRRDGSCPSIVAEQARHPPQDRDYPDTLALLRSFGISQKRYSARKPGSRPPSIGPFTDTIGRRNRIRFPTFGGLDVN